MLTGTMTSELDGNARIWTLDVERTPRAGELLSWNEPALGSIPARTDVRGWVSGDQSMAREGTVVVTVAAESTRWVRMRTPRGNRSRATR